MGAVILSCLVCWLFLYNFYMTFTLLQLGTLTICFQQLHTRISMSFHMRHYTMWYIFTTVPQEPMDYILTVQKSSQSADKISSWFYRTGYSCI